MVSQPAAIKVLQLIPVWATYQETMDVSFPSRTSMADRRHPTDVGMIGFGLAFFHKNTTKVLAGMCSLISLGTNNLHQQALSTIHIGAFWSIQWLIGCIISRWKSILELVFFEYPRSLFCKPRRQSSTHCPNIQNTLEPRYMKKKRMIWRLPGKTTGTPKATWPMGHRTWFFDFCWGVYKRQNSWWFHQETIRYGDIWRYLGHACGIWICKKHGILAFLF